MKRLLLYMLACLAFVGCSDMYEEGKGLVPMESPRYLNASKTYMAFEATPAEQKVLTVLSVQTPWRIVNNSNWVSLSVDSERVTDDRTTDVEIIPTENESGDTARTHILILESTVSDWHSSIPVKVVQKNATPYVEPEQTNVMLSGKKQTYSMPIQSNIEWQCKSTESWIKVNRSEDDLLISVEGNNTKYARKGEISLEGAANAVVSIEQDPANLYATTDTITFDRVAGTYSLSVEADLQWHAYTNESWIQVSPEKGEASDNVIEISVTPNNSTSVRNGNVYVAIETKTVKIPVFQHSYYTTTDQSEVVFGSHGGTMVLTVSSNDSWKSDLEENDWLTLSERSGVGSKELILIAKDNPSLNTRSVPMVIASDNCGDIHLDIIQSPRYLVASSSAVSFFGKGGKEIVHISTDGKYKVEKNGDWFTITQSGDDLTIFVPENNTGSWLNGSITITLTDLTEGELSVVVPVEQALQGKRIDKTDYDSDEDWNDDKSEWGLKVSVVGYHDDEDWSTNPNKTESDINNSDYSDDEDWTNKE